jgi:colanic acid/amylovoran biosynthesis glycosyltransferase
VSPPRLAYLLKKFPRLSETFILSEMLGQESLGAQLHVFSRRPPDPEPQHPQLARLRATVELLPPSREIDPWTELFVRDDGEVLRRVEALTRSGGLALHPRFPQLLAEAVLLRRRCAELEIGHIHVHFASEGTFVAHLLRTLGGPTYSFTMHAKDIYRHTVDGALLDRLIMGAEFVVTVCDANVRYLSTLVGAAALRRVRRLYNGIDLQAFMPGDGPRDAAHVVAVGRLVEKKGFAILVEAVALLAARGLPVRATLVGDGEERPRLEALVAERGLGEWVQLAGALDQTVVLDLLRRATVCCLPCLVGQDGNRDALPTALIESLACGLPVVSTPVTGIPEIVDGGRAGLLVPEGDVAATADAIAALVTNPDECARLAAAGRARAEVLFDLARNATVLRGWFDEALAREREPCSSPA